MKSDPSGWREISMTSKKICNLEAPQIHAGQTGDDGDVYTNVNQRAGASRQTLHST